MSINERYAMNGQIRIHYLDSKETADESLIPIVVCPGLSETAEEYADFLKAAAPRRCILLSFRGRGKSDTPDSGYDLEEHIADLEAVINAAGIQAFHLFAYSRGVSYALGYAHRNIKAVRSVILGDYPPEHRAMPDGWAEDYIDNYLIPFKRTSNIRPETVRGIQRESTQIRLDQPLEIPILAARGLLEGSLIDDTAIARYCQMSSTVIVKGYANSGHALKGEDKESFFGDIIRFINDREDGEGKKK